MVIIGKYCRATAINCTGKAPITRNVAQGRNCGKKCEAIRMYGPCSPRTKSIVVKNGTMRTGPINMRRKVCSNDGGTAAGKRGTFPVTPYVKKNSQYLGNITL